ncbi:hypothetical protein PPTG_12425 [Phytophthora nicotianae INRA-310]|uniref:Uncharacterized protein n=1 Tax=Phytophthora nicotianae (strain INRA-310) TaxID=761204 RepID=W2Q421_PHYN3|nr:hypothetical protein PPTG_12425 [Phytophthora nicotianae INRA-310]ETN07892.1 hypothetical protein PPTG_12425 [Phytophthora nicotianae INRA-310]
MRVHKAVWHFAATGGNDYTRRYAINRLERDDTMQIERDSKFLRGWGGMRLRSAWHKLGDTECKRRMLETSDDTFPKARTKSLMNENGENWCPPQDHLAPVIHVSDDIANELNPNNLELLKNRTVRMAIARSSYYDVLASEHMLRIHDSYNSGSLVGVMQATLESIKYAIVLAKVKYNPRTSEEAFDAVPAFEPDSDYDQPEPSFAETQIRKVKNNYDEAKSILNDLFETLGVNLPKAVEIGTPGSKFFGTCNSVIW